jgi:uncharacterized membrane protein
MENEPVTTKREIQPLPNRKVIWTIIGLLVVWSAIIALGAIVRADEFDVRKPLIVLGTMGAFLGVWLIALLFREPRGVSKP